MSAQEYCRVCKAKALLNDNQQPYCSKMCQIIDWPKQKLSCLEMSELVPMNPTTPNTDVDLMAPLPSTSNLTPRRRFLNSLMDRHFDRNDHGDSSDNKLVSLNVSPKTVVVSDERSSPTSTIIAQKQIEPEPRVKAAWQITFPPPKNCSFEVIVQYINNRRRDGELFLWVTQFRYISSLQKMINDINSTIDVRQATPGANEHVCVGALVAALTNNVLQRAEVMHVNKARQLAAVRFIDIGMQQKLSFSKIFKPIPSMFSVNQYAFCVCVTDTTRAIKEGELVKIRVLDVKTVDSIEILTIKYDWKAVPILLPVDLLEQPTDVRLVKRFEGGQHALVQMTHLYQQLPNMSRLIDYYSDNLLDFDHPSDRDLFVAAQTCQGWERAALLGCIENSCFLVYLIDVGRIGICREIKMIPLAIAAHPAAVIAIYSSDDKQLPIASTSDWCLKSELLVSRPASTLRCILLDKNELPQTVVATSVFSDLSQLYVKHWREPTAHGKKVAITHVISYNEVFVSSAALDDYPSMFAEIAPDCATFTESDNIVVGDCVLVMPEVETKSVFRADVLEIVDSGYNVRNIDTGASLIVSRQMLRIPNVFIRACPVYAHQVKLYILETLTNVMPNNMALVMLKRYCHSSTRFQLKYQNQKSNQPYPVVDLVYLDYPDQTLSKKLLPLLFEPAAKESDEMVNNKLSMASEKALNRNNPTPPPSTSATPVLACSDKVQAADASAMSAQSLSPDVSDAGTLHPGDAGNAILEYDLEDLYVVDITTGQYVELLILDISTLDQGYITAADFNKREFLERQCKDYFPQLDEYCKNATKPVGYEPSYNKLCLAIDPADGEWHRALRIKDQGNDATIYVKFIDFGNIGQVSKETVLPVPYELMFPTNANVCFFKNALTKEQILVLKTKQTLQCKVTERGQNEYIIWLLPF